MGTPEGSSAARVYRFTSPEAFNTDNFKADKALELIDFIITDVYMPFRGQEGFGTERATIVEDEHVSHRENNAEHSHHLALTMQALWHNREELGLIFPESYNNDKAVVMAVNHDLSEIWFPDVDSTHPDDELHQRKHLGERLGVARAKRDHPQLLGILSVWDEYERRDSSEAMLGSDIDKIAATRVICLDGGRKWRRWQGKDGKVYTTSRQKMCETVRKKLVTEVGIMLFDEIEKDLDNHPEYFLPEES